MLLTTKPPIYAPHPIPRLNIPENIDIAIDVAYLGAKRIVLSWKAMLNAVAIAPQKIHTNIIVNIQKAATCINIKDKAVPNVTTNIKR